MRFALLAVCIVLPASAFVLGCKGHGQIASTSAAPRVETAMPTTAMPTTMMHQPPPRTPEQ